MLIMMPRREPDASDQAIGAVFLKHQLDLLEETLNQMLRLELAFATPRDLIRSAGGSQEKSDNRFTYFQSFHTACDILWSIYQAYESYPMQFFNLPVSLSIFWWLSYGTSRIRSVDTIRHLYIP